MRRQTSRSSTSFHEPASSMRTRTHPGLVDSTSATVRAPLDRCTATCPRAAALQQPAERAADSDARGL
jgi:hypothetical protein